MREEAGGGVPRVVGLGDHERVAHLPPPRGSALTSFITLTCNFVLEWCDKIKLSNLLLPRKGGTIKSLQLLSTRLQCMNYVSTGVPGS